MDIDTTAPTIDANAAFLGKTHAHVVATTGAIIRVWDDTPNTAIVPSVDADGKRFEFVFEDGRKALFDTHTRDRVLEGGCAITAEGFWRKRTWKKTKTTGGWGHTWQFIVAAWVQDDVPFGHVPEGMKPALGASERDSE